MTRNRSCKSEIREMMKGFDSSKEFYVGRLTEGIATLGAAFYPKRVIVRLSDFKSKRIRQPGRRRALRAGSSSEPNARFPWLLGRYVSDSFRDCFALECDAVKRVRNEMG